ncbi:hypothetical protein L9F63_010025, partial [Diploptera punctata]
DLEMVRLLRTATCCMQGLAELCALRNCDKFMATSFTKHVTGFRSYSCVGDALWTRCKDGRHEYSSSSALIKNLPASVRHYNLQPVPEHRKTSLYDFHVSLQGRMVPFGGYLLPVSYGSEGIAASHLHTRKHCSLFDVSHMMQTEVRGRDRLTFLESITTADLVNLPDNTAALTVFTDPLTGGILDDLIITKTTLGYYHLVSNASRRSQDQKLLKETQAALRARGKDIELRFLDPDEQALLALQGPDMAKVLQPLTDVDLSELYFMDSTLATVAGVPRCRITRCGYTGEDGVEISIPADEAGHQSSPAGLGARASLRLEAGLCLYGNDIDHTTTPVEAGLSWVVAKRRRTTADFPGASVIIDQLRDGPGKKRVGIISRGNLRPGVDGPHSRIARLDTSGPSGLHHLNRLGSPSRPSLGGNIAMGYVRTEMS